MWSRVIEIMLGLWMWMSPFIFRHSEDATALWINDYATGALCMLFGTLSYWHPARHSHLGNFLVACWLIGFAYAHAGSPTAPAYQNHLLVGLLLLMFSVIPNRADEPSEMRRTFSPGPR